VIVAYWVAAHSNSVVEKGKDTFPPIVITLKMKNSGIKKPVLIDVVSGDITPLEFKKGSGDTLESLPLRDSVMAIADADYFDWPVLPEAPSNLRIEPFNRDSIGYLRWDLHGGSPTKVAIEGRDSDRGAWHRIQVVAPDARALGVARGAPACLRVRAINDAGESAYSNIVCGRDER
jgi:hypothetical protein